MIRVAAAVLLALVTGMIPMRAQPVFSSRVDGVRVDVLVTDSSRRPMRGLAAADFIIRDNGVPQQVEVVSFGEIALNVGLAFDMSESVAGVRLERLRAASRSLAAELREGDQSALILFDHVVSMPCPLSTNRTCVNDALEAPTPNGFTALVDGVLAGMIVGESDVGRSLLMVFSDGLDTGSYLPAERVLDLGRRSDVVVYAITSRDRRPDFLGDLASLTGGRLFAVGDKEDLSRTFRTVLDEFRHRYLITYTPKGVPSGGWHKLDVRVNRPGASVKARPGYQGR